MSILIKGMEMPEFGEKIIILTSSGYVEDVSGQVIDGVEAIHVPAHGRLIDADALKFSPSEFWGFQATDNAKSAETIINEAPTIIPAEKNHNA